MNWVSPYLTRQGARSVYDRVVKARIYVDASVVGGCEDDEFSAHSMRLMECFVRGDLVLVVSTLTLQELAAAPQEVRRHIAGVPEGHIETLQLDAEARELRVQLCESAKRLSDTRDSGTTGGAAR